MFDIKIPNFFRKIPYTIMSKFNIEHKSMLTAVQGCCTIALASALFTLVTTYATVTAWDELHGSIRKDLTRINVEYRNSLVVTKYEIMSIHAQALRDTIASKIEKTYTGKRTDLQYDIETYIDNNDKENKLLHIFNDCSYEYINRWFANYPDVRVIIANRDNFMFTSTLKEPMRVGAVPGVVFDRTPRTGLVLTNKGEVSAHSFDYIVQNMDVDKNMEVLAVSYIYDHDDVLGVRDVLPNGEPSKNSKLAIMLAYQPISEYHMHVLEHTNEVIAESVNNSYLNRVLGDVWYVGIAFIAFIIFGLFWQILDEDDEYVADADNTNATESKSVDASNN